LFEPTIVLALWNDSEATRLRALPGRTKDLRIELPSAGVLVAGLCERLAGHLAVLARLLKKMESIHYRRGLIRDKLEENAPECYAEVKRKTDKLFQSTYSGRQD